MKVIKDGKVYVNLSDIQFLGGLPRKIKKEMKFCLEPNKLLIELSSKEAIEYFKKAYEIVDYSDICGKSDEELLQQINNELDILKVKAEEWVLERRKETKKVDEKYNKLFRGLNYRIYTIKEYIQKRSKYDKEYGFFNQKKYMLENVGD